MKYLTFLLLLLCLCSASCTADQHKSMNANLSYTANEFTLFYTLEGDNGLNGTNQQDLNHNQVPDFIEATALQLQSAALFYSQVLGLTPPLQQERYKNKAKFIAVTVKKIARHGKAADEISRLKTPDGKLPALTITLANDLAQDNLTPAHELFHLYQNGYSLFKNTWLTEGSARWAEFAFAEGVGQEQLLPARQEQLDHVLKESYEAKTLWNRLAHLCDQNEGHFELPGALNKLDPLFPSVFKDFTVHGLSFMRTLYQELEALSKTASDERGVTLYKWSEKDQKQHPDNNDYILCAVKTAIAKTCSTKQLNSPEMSAFLAIANNYPHCNL